MWMDSFWVIMDVKVRKNFVLGSQKTFFLNVYLGIGSLRVVPRMS
jgi:hypothetical protein